MKTPNLLKNLNHGPNEAIKPSQSGDAPKPEGKSSKKRVFLSSKISEQLKKAAAAGNIANALISSIGEGLIIVDEYGHISHINNQALEILGYDRKDLEGSWLAGVLKIKDKNGIDLPPEERPSTKAIITGRPVTEVIHYQKKDGSLIPVSTTTSPFLIKDRPRGVVLIFRDITKELQIEKAKDEFVTLASHQLRTPLTSIRFFTELLRDSPEARHNKKQKNYIDKILFSTEKMIDLVTDLLNVSRLDLGQLAIKPEPTSLNKLVLARIDEIKPIAKNRRIKLIFNSEISDLHKIPVDRNLMAQVVHNLLSNAVRYSNPGTGIVEVSITKKSKFIVLSVADNGIGIPTSAKSKIFDRFYRADNAVAAQGDGTGLGLYLIKVIMEECGGQIKFTSRQNKGTVFFVSIPVSGMKPSIQFTNFQPYID